jgi:ComF family protein
LCQTPLLQLSAAPVCQPCWNLLVPQDTDLCIRCGEDLGIAQFSPSEEEPALQLCHSCELVPPDFHRAIAFGTYEGPLRKLIHLLKYDRVEPIARGLAARVAPQIAPLLHTATGNVLVVPVPLHRSKRRERGFNQSQLLARAIIAAVRKLEPGLQLTLAPDLLQRTRATQSQSVLTTNQRRRNLRGAFSISAAAAEKLAGREVLLIDDIYTTGATARACSKALRKAGAAKVWVATVARAQREGVARWDAGQIAVSAPVGFVSLQ